MSKRQAIDTIKGYFYQFDYTIKKILESSDESDEITIEGVEDIDIKTANEETAIQCKYYEKTEYNHSVIAKPIRLMISDFKERKVNNRKIIKYKLYGYYKSGQDKLLFPISISFIKDHFLTFTEGKTKVFFHIDQKISDQEIEEFITLLEIDINARQYDEQFGDILAYLEGIFGCSKAEASFYYYNNCLRIIKDHAKDDIKERKISKTGLLSTLKENKHHIFNQWYIAFRGKKEYLSLLKNEYFTGLNISPFARFFLIEVPNHNYKRSEIKEIIFIIVQKWSITSNRASTRFSPYIFLFGIEEKEFRLLRNELNSEGIIINDGYSFTGAEFNAKEITKEPLVKERAIKWVNEITLLETVFNELKNSTKIIYQFYFETPFFTNLREDVNDINIQVELLTDIKSLI